MLNPILQPFLCSTSAVPNLFPPRTPSKYKTCFDGHPKIYFTVKPIHFYYHRGLLSICLWTLRGHSVSVFHRFLNLFLFFIFLLDVTFNLYSVAFCLVALASCDPILTTPAVAFAVLFVTYLLCMLSLFFTWSNIVSPQYFSNRAISAVTKDKSNIYGYPASVW